MKLPIKKLHPDAIIPTFAHADDAGLDLHSTGRVEVAPHTRVVIPIGIAMAIPVGYVGLIWDKSGLAIKSGLKVLGGVIDAGYRGEIMVGILNTATEPFVFEVGQKVAQMLIQKINHPEIVETSDLDETERGEGSLGSTGQ